MENLLRDGDYVPNGFGGFTRLYGAQEVLAKALFKLTCRRGSFPFLQDLGSRLYELGRLRPSEREAAAKIYCEQALQGMGLTVDEALSEVDSFIDRAILNGQTVVYLIHGNGTGALRTAIHKHLRGNRMVKSFRLGRYGEGESGVTVVELK